MMKTPKLYEKLNDVFKRGIGITLYCSHLKRNVEIDAYCLTGNVILKVVPFPNSLSTLISPLWSLIIP
jgi:hypothetical protein